jgi:hypothetical protein
VGTDGPVNVSKQRRAPATEHIGHDLNKRGVSGVVCPRCAFVGSRFESWSRSQLIRRRTASKFAPQVDGICDDSVHNGF